MTFKVPNQYRIKYGQFASEDSIGACGAFEIPVVYPSSAKSAILLDKMPPSILSKKPIHSIFFVIADDGLSTYGGWEHISVHKIFDGNPYTPSWDDMCLIKNLFWDEEDYAVQFHPPKSEYVNNHPYVLHLWRWIDGELPRPPTALVGII